MAKLVGGNVDGVVVVVVAVVVVVEVVAVVVVVVVVAVVVVVKGRANHSSGIFDTERFCYVFL